MNPEELLPKLLGKEAGIEANAILADLREDFGIPGVFPPKKQYKVSDPNKVKVTFSVYANTDCDASDPAQSVTVSMESAVNPCTPPRALSLSLLSVCPLLNGRMKI